MFGCNCNCDNKIRILELAIGDLRSCPNVPAEPIPFPCVRIPMDRKKFDLELVKWQNESPVYDCKGGVNGQSITEFTYADVRNVRNDHLDNILEQGIDFSVCHSLLFVPVTLKNQIEWLYRFIPLMSYPSYANDIYEYEFGCLGEIPIMLFKSEDLSINEPSVDKRNAMMQGKEVYSSFMVTRNAQSTLMVTHIRSTRS